MATFALLIPVYEEERTLESVLKGVIDLKTVDQIVLVNDGSKDRTGEILDQWQKKHPEKLKVIHHEVNKGKGAAIGTGVQAATTDYLVIQDADLEYDLNDLKFIFEKVVDPSIDVVYGSRFIRANRSLYWTYYWGNKIITTFINLVAGGRLTDSYTCYKCMSTSRWQRLELNSRGFEVEAEISTKCLLAGWRIVEVPINYRPRSFEAGKKIRGKDAIKGMLKSLGCLFKRTYPREVSEL